MRKISKKIHFAIEKEKKIWYTPYINIYYKKRVGLTHSYNLEQKVCI